MYSTQSGSFNAWMDKLNAIVQRRVGCDLDDLEDFDTYDTYDAFEDGMTPAEFYREVIAPEVRIEEAQS